MKRDPSETPKIRRMHQPEIVDPKVVRLTLGKAKRKALSAYLRAHGVSPLCAGSRVRLVVSARVATPRRLSDS